jgi:hypothetical protein
MTSLVVPPNPCHHFTLIRSCHGNVGGAFTSGWPGRRFISTNHNVWSPWPSGTHSFLLPLPILFLSTAHIPFLCWLQCGCGFQRAWNSLFCCPPCSEYPAVGGTLANLYQTTRSHIPEGGRHRCHRLSLEIFLFCHLEVMSFWCLWNKIDFD